MSDVSYFNVMTIWGRKAERWLSVTPKLFASQTERVSFYSTGAKIQTSTAALQYDEFKRQVAEERKVFTFTNVGKYLAYPVRGHEVIPFWSSHSRIVTVKKSHSQYQRYEITEMGLDEFIQWFPQLAAEGIHIGINWSGKRLIGYDISIQHLKAAIEYWMKREH